MATSTHYYSSSKEVKPKKLLNFYVNVKKGQHHDQPQSNSYHCSIFRHLLSYLALNQHSLSVIKQLAVIPPAGVVALGDTALFNYFIERYTYHVI